MNNNPMAHWFALSTWLEILQHLFNSKANNPMNPLMQWLASGTWMHIVQALLHTLWVGALAAGAVFIALRRTANPFVRYWCCMLGLTGVLMAGVVGWAVLEGSTGVRPTMAAGGETARLVPQPAVSAGQVITAAAAGHLESQPPLQARGRSANRWFCWLALAWVLGAGTMLGRAALGVMEAEGLRRSTQPLADDRLLAFVAEARRMLGICQAVRTMVAERLGSPAVVGAFWPTLILPLSLVTSMPPEQLRFIVLHELAHIRRGDYLANLAQLFIEALLFFNPAVWWLSRQARIEREACCDAVAIALAKDRAGYARALLEVAERSLKCPPAAAPAFADARRSGRLKERVQRLLAPGYRPSLRLTWKALAASLILGCGILIASAIAAQWTVGAAVRLLTPRQRIARIEAKMKSLGQPAIVEGALSGEIEVSGRVRTADGSPLPRRNIFANFDVFTPRTSIGQCLAPDKDGVCRTKVTPGDLFFSAMADGFAPAVLGPIDTRATNRVEGLELKLERGFPVSLKVTDADSGQPVTGASLSCQFWLPQHGSSLGGLRELQTDNRGGALLEHCGSIPLVVTVTKPGWETTQGRLEHPMPGGTLTISTRRALPIAGRVTDRASGAPIKGAGVYVLGAYGAPGIYGCQPDRPGPPLAVSNEKGRFEIRQLPRTGQYWLMVRASGHADAVLQQVHVGMTNLNVALGPELRVHGKFTGDLAALFKSSTGGRISLSYNYQNGEDSYRGVSRAASVRIDKNEGHFDFVLPVAGTVKITAGDRLFSRPVNASVKDWRIEVKAAANGGGLNGPNGVARRKVVIRFESPSGVQPQGTISAELPGPQPGTAIEKEIGIQNGRASFEAPVGWALFFEPARTIGFWFAGQIAVRVTNGPGPQIVSVPVVPAGAIYAQARNEDGSLASNVGFQVRELKRSPLVKDGGFTTPLSDSWFPNGDPREYVATPLPLAGTYVVIASQDNHFAVSRPIKLTGAAPDRSVELRFIKGAPIVGQVVSPEGKPFFGAKVEGEWRYKDSSFGLARLLTDEKGRFTLEDCTPGIGEYSVTVRCPGMQALSRTAEPNAAPCVLRLQPGLKLAGRVIDAASQRPIIGAEVRAVPKSGGQPMETTRTDDQGGFEFDTLRGIPYRLLVDGCYYLHGATVTRAGTAKPLVLKVNIDPGASVQLGRANAAPLRR